MTKEKMNEPIDEFAPVFSVTLAAQMSNMHPQTLRQYDNIGLVVPTRTSGKMRAYSFHDIKKLVEVQRLSTVYGINLEGIKRIIELEEENYNLRDQLRGIREGRIYEANSEGDLSIRSKISNFRLRRKYAKRMQKMMRKMRKIASNDDKYLLEYSCSKRIEI